MPRGGEAPPTGLLFGEQSVEGVAAAMLRFEEEEACFLPKALRARAEQFDRERFRAAMRAFLDARLAEPRPC